MRGFPTTKFTLVYRGIGRHCLDIDDGAGLVEKHKRMKEHGFEIDSEYDVYYKEGYGAWATNVDSCIKTADDMATYYDSLLKMYVYKDHYEQMKNEGYEYVIGPGVPADNGKVYGNGLFLKNYKEIAEKLKKQEQEERAKVKSRKKGTIK